jgi:hypothetical protein
MRKVTEILGVDVTQMDGGIARELLGKVLELEKGNKDLQVVNVSFLKSSEELEQDLGLCKISLDQKTTLLASCESALTGSFAKCDELRQTNKAMVGVVEELEERVKVLDKRAYDAAGIALKHMAKSPAKDEVTDIKKRPTLIREAGKEAQVPYSEYRELVDYIDSLATQEPASTDNDPDLAFGFLGSEDELLKQIKLPCKVKIGHTNFGKGIALSTVIGSARRLYSYTQEPASDWVSMDSAPKGGGADRCDDPEWIEPPKILLLFNEGIVSVGYWDWYYAEGGRGYEGGLAWIEPISGERLDMNYDPPIGWQPITPPKLDKEVGEPPMFEGTREALDKLTIRSK